MADVEVYAFAKSIGAPLELVREVKRLGRLPVVNFAAGACVCLCVEREREGGKQTSDFLCIGVCFVSASCIRS